jgi:hypothetical protein
MHDQREACGTAPEYPVLGLELQAFHSRESVCLQGAYQFEHFLVASLSSPEHPKLNLQKDEYPHG